MRHALEEKSTPEQIKVAQEAADWLLDGIATATQDRMFLRGDPEYDIEAGQAILANGRIACLRAIHNLTPDIAKSEADALRAALEAAADALDEAFRALGDAGEAMGDEGPSRHEARAFLAAETARAAIAGTKA